MRRLRLLRQGEDGPGQNPGAVEALRIMRALARIAGLLALGGFLYIAHAVKQRDVSALDQQVLHYLRGFEAPWLEALARSFHYISGRWEIVLAIPIFFLMLAWRRYHDAQGFLLVHLGGGAITRIFKPIFHLERPPAVGFKMTVLDHYGFPSGHVLMSVCGYGYLAVLIVMENPRKPWRWVCGLTLVAIPFGVMWSRLYLAVHWFSDVLAAALVAFAWLCFCLSLRQTIPDSPSVLAEVAMPEPVSELAPLAAEA